MVALPNGYWSLLSLLFINFRQFSGFAGEKEFIEELEKLRKALARDQIEYVEGFFYYCGYDSPMKLVNRRNEVWLLKKEK